MRSAKTDGKGRPRSLTVVPRTKVNAGKCHIGIHSRSRTRPNSSISLSTVPRLKRARTFAPRPIDLESQFWPRNPAFSQIFEPTPCDCEQTYAFMVNNDSYVTINWSLTVIDEFTRSRFIKSLLSEKEYLNMLHKYCICRLIKRLVQLIFN